MEIINYLTLLNMWMKYKMGNGEYKSIVSSIEYCSKNYEIEVYMVSHHENCSAADWFVKNNWNSLEFFYRNKQVVFLKGEAEIERVSLGKNFEVSNEQPDGMIFTISFVGNYGGHQRWKIRCKLQEDFTNWTKFIKKSLRNEWKKSSACQICRKKFGVFYRKHHCRKCGSCVCDKCSPFRSTLPELDYCDMVRICQNCGKNIEAKRKGALSNSTPNFNRNKKYFY